MKLQRRRDWPTHLHALVTARMRTPFAWGSHDCVLWVADCVMAITGLDLAAEHRGQYHTALGALRVVPEGGLAALVGQYLPTLDVRRAVTGDIVLVRLAGQDSLAVVNGGAALGPGADGLEAVDLRAAVAAWKVG